MQSTALDGGLPAPPVSWGDWVTSISDKGDRASEEHLGMRWRPSLSEALCKEFGGVQGECTKKNRTEQLPAVYRSLPSPRSGKALWRLPFGHESSMHHWPQPRTQGRKKDHSNGRVTLTPFSEVRFPSQRRRRASHTCSGVPPSHVPPGAQIIFFSTVLTRCDQNRRWVKVDASLVMTVDHDTCWRWHQECYLH